jgi:hypothetical protein
MAISSNERVKAELIRKGLSAKGGGYALGDRLELTLEPERRSKPAVFKKPSQPTFEHKVAAWAVLVASAIVAAVIMGPLETEASEYIEIDFMQATLFAIVNLAGLSLFLLSVLDGYGHVECTRPFAVFGSSVTMAATITYAGLVLASTGDELVNVKWLAMVLYSLIALASAIATVVGGIRALQGFIRNWQDPSGERAEETMRQRERVEGFISLVTEWVLAVVIIIVVLGCVASYRRPSLHVSRTDMAGKVVIITESCSGRGLLHAEALAAWNAHVTVACEDEELAKDTAASITAASGNPNVRGALLDLRSLGSVRAFAKKFADTHRHLDVLVNSADVGVTGKTSGEALLSHDGLDSVLQVGKGGSESLCIALKR